jgi:2-oxoglutarate ferredoxin oxidoreductase subunit gamma
MSQVEFLFAGFGGQGVLFAGQVLAYAGLEAGRQVTWIPSYGPEMRGGTANCTVIVAREPIGAPLVRHPRVLVALNEPSLEKYEPTVARGGILVVNRSIISLPVLRTDLTVLDLDAQHLAEQAGSAKVAAIALLGAAVQASGVLTLAEVAHALERHLPERHRRLLAANLKALELGAAAALVRA